MNESEARRFVAHFTGATILDKAISIRVKGPGIWQPIYENFADMPHTVGYMLVTLLFAPTLENARDVLHVAEMFSDMMGVVGTDWIRVSLNARSLEECKIWALMTAINDWRDNK